MSVLRRTAVIVLAALLLVAAVPLASQQPPSDAKQEYVPVDRSQEQEQLPAAPLVIGAYAVVWVAAVLYLWSIWQRLSRVEREIAQLSRRLEAEGKR